jgi:hypothetical protein
MRQVVSSVIRWVRRLEMARASGRQAGAEPRSVSRDTTRLMAFSDGVFAITITLLGHQQALSARPGLAGDRRPARRPAARPGVAVIFAFNVFYWLPIPGESPGDRQETSA